MEIGQEAITKRANAMFDMVLARVTEEVKLSWHFKDNLKKLKKTLEKMNAILLNSSGAAAETSTQAVHLWLSDLEDIAYDAENMLDGLAFEKVQQTLVKKLSFSSSKKLHLLFSPSNPVLIRWEMGRWVHRIDSAIQAAYQEAHTLGLRPADLPSHAAASAAANAVAEHALRQIRDIPDTSFVVGRTDDKAKVVDMLCNCDNLGINVPSVVAIIGLGGLGKTVVAHEVYEDEQVKRHFSERIWITVSRDFKIDKILKGMVEFIKKSKFDCDSVELTVQTLSEHLSGKRYLLVLDDVWNSHQNTWDTLHNALRRTGGSTDSNILVTTRDRGVAETMHTSLIHCLPELSPNDSWSLFKRIAFANMTPEQALVLEEIGKRIVNKCWGVPLAIKTIAGVLNDKSRAHDWELVDSSYLWDLDNKAGILPSLMLSYTCLSSPLKKCFSFFALYIKGTSWPIKFIIRLWIANGFLQQPRYGKTMEDIGAELFTTFLRISFVQEAERDDLGEVTHFTMHDLVHDLATYVGKPECMSLGSKIGDTRGHNLDKVKHLRLTCQNSAFSHPLVLRNLRSLEIVGNLPKGILSHVKYLRSLDLIDLNLEEVPKSIAGMKCLKFLNLSGNPIRVLPDWIMSLYNLQTLYLYNCPNIIRIPKGLGNLVNLRHFMVDRILELPTGVEQLSCLQTLPPLWVRDEGFQIAELRDLHEVSGQLKIVGLELVKSKQDAEKAKLSDKSKVEQLYLGWTTGNSDDHSNDLAEEVLEGLYPNSNLRVLTIKNYASKKFPAWVMKMDVSKYVNSRSQQLLCNLIKIELIKCTRCEELPTMGHLPCLKFLKISEMESLKRIGRALYCCDETIIIGTMMVCFPKLEELRLNNLDNLEEWCEPEAAVVCFPRLELLMVELCAKLRTTPNKFPSLKKFAANGITSGLPVSSIIRNKTTLGAMLIRRVEELESLPELAECTSLGRLRIWHCPKLSSLPDLSGLTSLSEVSIGNNDTLRCPPSGLKSCTSLQILEFYRCSKSKAITEDLSGLSRLYKLRIVGQTELISQPPDWLLNGLPRLQYLSIGRYEELDHFPDISPLLRIPSLIRLLLEGWPKLQSHTLPDQLERFTRLTDLIVDNFEQLEQLPECLGNLSSMERLALYRCPKLRKLPSKDVMQRLTNLRSLHIWECPLMVDSVKINGAEHHKVAHIRLRFPNYNLN